MERLTDKKGKFVSPQKHHRTANLIRNRLSIVSSSDSDEDMPTVSAEENTMPMVIDVDDDLHV